MPDDETLRELAELDAGATPGPWEVLAGDYGRRIGCQPLRVLGIGNPVVAEVGDLSRFHYDAALIVWLRNNAPALIASQAAEIGSMRDVVEAAGESGMCDCWAPCEEISDLGGHISEVDCGICPGCVLRDAVARLATASSDAHDCADMSWSGDGLGRWRCDVCNSDQGAQDDDLGSPSEPCEHDEGTGCLSPERHALAHLATHREADTDQGEGT